jgi:hypothetical protein
MRRGKVIATRIVTEHDSDGNVIGAHEAPAYYERLSWWQDRGYFGPMAILCYLLFALALAIAINSMV